MYDTIVGEFKKKSEYKEAAKRAMVRAVLADKEKRYEHIKGEYQQYFGYVAVIKCSWDCCSVVDLKCHHLEYVSLKDMDEHPI